MSHHAILYVQLRSRRAPTNVSITPSERSIPLCHVRAKKSVRSINYVQCLNMQVSSRSRTVDEGVHHPPRFPLRSGLFPQTAAVIRLKLMSLKDIVDIFREHNVFSHNSAFLKKNMSRHDHFPAALFTGTSDTQRALLRLANISCVCDLDGSCDGLSNGHCKCRQVIIAAVTQLTECASSSFRGVPNWVR